MTKLLYTFNKGWMEGEQPAEWKRSTIISVPKPGKTTNAIATSDTNHCHPTYSRFRSAWSLPACNKYFL
ncbi:hypothetical protein HPB47_006142 [Ixodes persulcatus]|uniref:Uncharacterized protein n=1 Tax=Ixodes persulcatus TaxID=34615 RepID=A0AC60PBB9_IXOPE|nr:hypothetical protein HPB47_006142 [Ixodes persulcatus]